ncbi:MAG: LemA family protein [Bacilli bacterium]|nr:LemA family protein [Bacilli bacterium]
MIIAIISAFVATIALIILFFKLKANTITLCTLKIEEAEKELEIFLSKKLSLLSELQAIFSERDTETEFDFLCNLEDIDDDEFKLNTILNKAYKELKEFLNDKRSFIPDEQIKEKLDELYKVDIECSAIKNYYNDKVIILNNKIKSFPNSLIAKTKGIYKKELYNDPIEEEFEILKKK